MARAATGGNRKFLLGVAIGLAPVVLFGGVGEVVADLGTGPDAGGPPAIESGETLVLDPDDAAFMSRIFRERDHEIGYCVAIDDGRLGIWLADTVTAGTGTLEMKTSNCPPEMRDATAHTHPSGQVGLSARDAATLAAQDAGVMCIHAGALATDPGARLDHLVCYQRTAVGDPEPVPVRLAGAA